MNKRALRGFTLVELLTVITVMGVVSTLVISSLIGMLDHWRRVQAQTDLGLQAERVLERMREDISSTLSPSLTEARIAGVHRNANIGSPYFADLKDDSIKLPVRIRNSSPQWMHYYIKRDGFDHTLMRSSWPLSAGEEMPATEATEAAAPDVSPSYHVLSLYIEYRARGETQWLNDTDWNRPENPEAIRISIVLGHNVFTDEQVSRKIVCTVL